LLGKKKKFSIEDFCSMQLDLYDLRAKEVLPDLIKILQESKDEEVRLASKLLDEWDCTSSTESRGACLYYPFLDRFWQRKYMYKVLKDKLINLLPLGAPGLNRFDISSFINPTTAWIEHEGLLKTTIQEEMKTVVDRVKLSLGNDHSKWRWGDLHKIQFQHSLNNYPAWENLKLGPDEIGGSPTTLGMAMHMGKGPGKTNESEVPCKVYHGPAYRLVVDLADPQSAKFVIAGGNGGRVDSEFCLNQYSTWLKGQYFTLKLKREEIDEQTVWQFGK
jgi:penicillin amidase